MLKVYQGTREEFEGYWETFRNILEEHIKDQKGSKRYDIQIIDKLLYVAIIETIDGSKIKKIKQIEDKTKILEKDVEKLKKNTEPH